MSFYQEDEFHIMFHRHRRDPHISQQHHAETTREEKTIENTPLELTPQAVMKQLYQIIQQYPRGSRLRAAGIIAYQDFNPWRPWLDIVPPDNLQLRRISIQLTNLLNDFTDPNIKALIDYVIYSKLGNTRRQQRQTYDYLLVSFDLMRLGLITSFIFVGSACVITAAIGIDIKDVATVVFVCFAVFFKLSRLHNTTPVSIFMKISACAHASLVNYLRSLAQVPSGREEHKALLKQCEAEQAFMEKMAVTVLDPCNIFSEQAIYKIIGSYGAPIKLESLDCIRVIVNGGRGMGHQRAAITLMRKLREMGFNGLFDVRYNDFFACNWHTYSQLQNIGYVGKILVQLIPGFKPKSMDSLDAGWECLHPDFGLIRVTRLPSISLEKNHDLPLVKLTVSGGGDNAFPEKICDIYCTDYYIQLQPTDWQEESRYIVSKNNEPIYLPNNLRLSSKNQLTIASLEDKLTPEQINIIQLCENKSINSQLVYGLYPASKLDPITNRMSNTGSLDPVLECRNLIEAHQIIQKENKKPVILLFPQKISMDSDFQKTINKLFDNILWLNLTNAVTFKSFDFLNIPKNKILMAYVGNLPPRLFDSLMLNKTTFPPIIEGCNAREACEFAGRAFIRGGSIHQPLDTYTVDDEKYYACQELHAKASLCLRTGNKDEIPALVTYMSAFNEIDFRIYHQKRQQLFLARPDACEVAFQELIANATPKTIKPPISKGRRYATELTIFSRGFIPKPTEALASKHHLINFSKHLRVKPM